MVQGRGDDVEQMNECRENDKRMNERTNKRVGGACHGEGHKQGGSDVGDGGRTSMSRERMGNKFEWEFDPALRPFIQSLPPPSSRSLSKAVTGHLSTCYHGSKGRHGLANWGSTVTSDRSILEVKEPVRIHEPMVSFPYFRHFLTKPSVYPNLRIQPRANGSSRSKNAGSG